VELASRDWADRNADRIELRRSQPDYRLCIVQLLPCLLHAVVDGVSFDSLEPGTLDHFDDLLFVHFYFAAGFDRIAVDELAAVGDGADLPDLGQV
jgi:hypothetical protein